jgi:hypothetical protein
MVAWSSSDAFNCVAITKAIIDGLDCVYDIAVGSTSFLAERKNNGNTQLLEALRTIEWKRPDCVVIFSQCECDAPDVWKIYRLDGRMTASCEDADTEEMIEGRPYD